MVIALIMDNLLSEGQGKLLAIILILGGVAVFSSVYLGVVMILKG